MERSRPSKYQKHIHKTKYLEWKRDDGSRQVFEFDDKYKVNKIYNFEPTLKATIEIPDFTKAYDDFSEINSEYERQNFEVEKPLFVIPLLNKIKKEIPHTRRLIDFPYGFSHILRHNMDNFIPHMLTA